MLNNANIISEKGPVLLTNGNLKKKFNTNINSLNNNNNINNDLNNLENHNLRKLSLNNDVPFMETHSNYFQPIFFSQQQHNNQQHNTQLHNTQQQHYSILQQQYLQPQHDRQFFTLSNRSAKFCKRPTSSDLEDNIYNYNNNKFANNYYNNNHKKILLNNKNNGYNNTANGLAANNSNNAYNKYSPEMENSLNTIADP